MHSGNKLKVSIRGLMYFSLNIIDPIGQRTLLGLDSVFFIFISLVLITVPRIHKTLNRSVLNNGINRFQNILNKWTNNSLRHSILEICDHQVLPTILF